MLRKNTFHLVSLGCAKNSVDSESISLILEKSGYARLEYPDSAELIIVNTCGFIKPARQESISTLREFIDHKQNGQILIAAGCLTERFRQELVREIGLVDGMLGTRHWMDILQVVRRINKSASPGTTHTYFPGENSPGSDDETIPRFFVQGKSAYLKIGDGCQHRCAFCAIPLIKGTQRSRRLNDILHDACILQDQNVLEINLIAQDTTNYGSDLGLKDGLTVLLDELTRSVPNIPWIRILYAFPGLVSSRLIEMMAARDQILPYLDLPLQHAHPDILRSMHRPADMDWVRRTIENLRQIIPHIALRSTFIVGYPGETDAHFQALLDFVDEIKFDHVGAFAYSFEAGTPAEKLGDPISEEIKLERLETLMLLQEKISYRKNQEWIGKTLSVLIEGSNEGISVGRSYRDAPEIDGLVLIYQKMEPGAIVSVNITGAMVHDMIGKVM